MLKNILNINGAQQLNKKEQVEINGGFWSSCDAIVCTPQSEGCPCYNPNSGTDGVGICSDGICYDC